MRGAQRQQSCQPAGGCCQQKRLQAQQAIGTKSLRVRSMCATLGWNAGQLA